MSTIRVDGWFELPEGMSYQEFLDRWLAWLAARECEFFGVTQEQTKDQAP